MENRSRSIIEILNTDPGFSSIMEFSVRILIDRWSVYHSLGYLNRLILIHAFAGMTNSKYTEMSLSYTRWIMKTFIWFVAFIALWFVLNMWILPWLGIST
jgi:hypothetical protein